MAKNNVYRDGKIHVMAVMCETCIFRPVSGRTGERIIREAVKRQSCVVCHHTIGTTESAVCAGFFAHHKTAPLALGQALGIIEKVKPNDKENTPAG